MAELPTVGAPKITSFEDFDVMSGKTGVSRAEYKASTFHTSTESDDGDAVFKKKAELMDGTASELMADVGLMETRGDKEAEATVKKEAGTR